MNDQLILMGGKSTTGKSLSLRNLRNPEGVMYLNCESNKKLPFKSKFQEYTITDPYQVYEAFTKAEEPDMKIHTIVIDSLTYLLDMFESVHVLTSSNTLQAWGEYAQYFKNLMAQYVAKSTKNVIFTAHTADVLNKTEMVNETIVKVKGSLMNNGIESYFSTVIAAKKIPLKQLEGIPLDPKLITVTEDEEMLGIKYCFQVRLTKETVDERIRSPMGMFVKTPDVDQTYTDNDVQVILDHLHNYYK